MLLLVSKVAVVCATAGAFDLPVYNSGPHALQKDDNLKGEKTLAGFDLEKVYSIRGDGKKKDEPAIFRHTKGNRSKRALQSTAATSTVDFSNERAKVRTLAAMNRLVYPPTNYEGSFEKVKELYEIGAELYTKADSTAETALERAQLETQIAQEWHDSFTAVVKNAAEGESWESVFNPTAGETDGLGVAAAVYESANEAVIVFRGSYTNADFNNMLLWFEGWFLDNLKQQIITDWTTSTGLALTAEQNAISAKGDLKNRAAFLSSTQALLAKQDLDWARLGLKNTFDVIVNGYWTITKQLVNTILADIGDGKAIYITGHSQGGGRAELVSMWLEKEKSLIYPTYTFSGVGTQCAVRYALPDQYGNDVDVNVLHSQITQYTHTLDAFGGIDYHTGKVCKYGTLDLIKSNTEANYFSPTKHFCSKIVGHTGSTLLLPFTEESKEFYTCRYFTHWSASVSYWLDQDSVLNLDGTTDGGCVDSTIIPAGDPQGLCPPCRTSRCINKLPKLAMNYVNMVQNPLTGAIQGHPCVADGTAIPTRLSVISPLTGELAEKFQQCLVLGGKSDYLMLGVTASDATTKVFNIAFRAVNSFLDAQFSASLFVSDVSGTDENGNYQLKQHVVFSYTESTGGNAPIVLLDREFTAATQTCFKLMNVVNVCLSSVEVTTGTLQTYLSVGLVNLSELRNTIFTTGSTQSASAQDAAIDAMTNVQIPAMNGVSDNVLSGVQDKSLASQSALTTNTLNAEEAMVIKIAELSQIGGLKLDATTIQLISRATSQDVMNALNSNMQLAAMYAQANLNVPTTNHVCFAGMTTAAITALQAGQKQIYGVVENAAMNIGKCMVLRPDAGVTISGDIAAASASVPTYTVAEAETCVDVLVNRIQTAATAVDGAMVDDIVASMGLTGANAVLTSNIATLKASGNIATQLQQSRDCVKTNNNLVETICAANGDVAFQLAVSADGDAVINRAVHYALVIQTILDTVNAQAGGATVLNDIVTAMNANRPAGWAADSNLADAQLEILDSMAAGLAGLADFGSARSCCGVKANRKLLKVDSMMKNAVFSAISAGNKNNANLGQIVQLISKGGRVMGKADREQVHSFLMAQATSNTANTLYSMSPLSIPAVSCSTDDTHVFNAFLASYLHGNAMLISKVAIAAGNGAVSNVNPFANANAAGNDLNWANAALDTKFGDVNNKRGNAWAFTTVFGGLAPSMRLDVVANAGSKIINEVVMASVTPGDKLRVTKDFGNSFEEVSLDGASAAASGATAVGSSDAGADAMNAITNCLKGAKMLGSFDVCFEQKDGGMRRSLQADEATAALKSFSVYVKSSNGIESAKLPVLEMPKPHPCLTRPWQGNVDDMTVAEIVAAVGETKSCTVLSEESYINVNSVCSSTNSCAINAEVSIANADRRRLGGNNDAYNAELEDVELGDENDRELQVAALPTQKLKLKFIKQSEDQDARVQFELNGYRMFDIDLVPETSQCLSAPGVMNVCVERSSEGFTLPDGWTIEANSAGSRRQLQSTRRELQTTESLLGLSVNILGVKRVFPLSAIDSVTKGMMLVKGSWTAFNNNEGFSTTKAPVHDECRHITCPEGTQCFRGVSGMDNCYPDLFSKGIGETRSYLQQLVRMARAPYKNFVQELYEEDGWSTIERFCLTHASEIPATLIQMEDRQDCAVISKKVIPQSVPTKSMCSISFEGSDDKLEPLEPAYKAGTTLINGFEVWRGVAREYRRFTEHPKFKSLWEPMILNTNGNNECSQIYITGHSLGAAVAVLHRLDYEIGRLVIFGTPAIFAPYSYPNFCYGDSFHMRDDIVKAFPLGFKLGGLVEYEMCSVDSGKVWNKGCNGYQVAASLDFCDILDNHKITTYKAFVDNHLYDASVKAVEYTDSCADSSTAATMSWLEDCVEKKCTAGDTMCAMGSEVLRASLSYESARATAISNLSPAKIPSLMDISQTATTGGTNVGNTAQAIQTQANQIGFEVVNAKEKALKDFNPNLCSTDILASFSTSNTKACAAIDQKSFVLVQGSQGAEGKAVEMEADLYLNVNKAAPSNTVQPTAALTLHASVLLPEELAIMVQVYPKGQPLFKLEYKLTPKTLFCKNLDLSAEACVVFAPVEGSTTVYGLDVVLFFAGESAYSTRFATMDSAPIPPKFTINPSLSTKAQFGNKAQRYLQTGFVQVEQNFMLGRAQGDNEYCAKVIPNIFCDFAAGIDACEDFRNAQCLPGGICGCPANHCASEQQVCVPETAPNALRQVGNPCMSPDEDVSMFTIRQDPSLGAPYDRCVALGSGSYIRMDYPSLSELALSPASLEVSLLTKIGFAVVPISVMRQLKVSVGLQFVVGGAGAGRQLQATTFAETFISVRIDESNVYDGSSRTLFSETLPANFPTEKCTLMSSSGRAKAVPIADLCARVSGAVVAATGVRVLSEESHKKGDLHRELQDDDQESRLTIAFCVPALYNLCYSIPIANVKRNPNLVKEARRGRALQEISEQQQSPFVLEAQVPAENSDMETSEQPSTGPVLTLLSPAVLVLLGVVVMCIIALFCSYFVSTYLITDVSAPTTLRTRQTQRLSASSITAEAQEAPFSGTVPSYSAVGVGNNNVSSANAALVEAIDKVVSKPGNRTHGQIPGVKKVPEISTNTDKIPDPHMMPPSPTGQQSSNGGGSKEHPQSPSWYRPSPVLLARKENPQLFSRIPQQAESDLVTIVAGWIPTNKRLRKLLLNAWPQHFCRVFLRQIPIIQLPQFPDEKYLWREDGKDEEGNPRRDRRDNDAIVDSQVMTPTIKSFLAFRRSVLMIFVGLALIIIIMGAVSEGPQMVQDLVIGRGEEKLTHDDVRSMMTLFRSATGSGQRTGAEKTSVENADAAVAGTVNDDYTRRILRGSVLFGEYKDVGGYNFDSMHKMADLHKIQDLHKLPLVGKYLSEPMRNLQAVVALQQQTVGSDDSASVNNGNNVPATTQSTVVDEAQNEDYLVEQAMEVKRRLKIFYTLVSTVKFFIASLTLFAAIKALRRWTNYKASARWTIFAFVARVSISVVISWFPWYYLIFGSDEEERPQEMNRAGRLFIDLILNIPVFAISFVLTPGLVSGSLLVMELLPFTVIPYFIIFAVPCLSAIMLWPILSIIGHGLANYKLLYGALFYIGYALFTSWSAFSALASLEAFRLLGRKAAKSQFPAGSQNNYQSLTGSQNQKTAHNSHNIMVSPKSSVQSPSTIMPVLLNTSEDKNISISEINKSLAKNKGVDTTQVRAILPTMSDINHSRDDSNHDTSNHGTNDNINLMNNNNATSGHNKPVTKSLSLPATAAPRRGSFDIGSWVLKKIKNSDEPAEFEGTKGTNIMAAEPPTPSLLERKKSTDSVGSTESKLSLTGLRRGSSFGNGSNFLTGSNSLVSTLTRGAGSNGVDKHESDDVQQLPSYNLFQASSKPTDGSFRGSSRRSIEVKDAVVQGTLISYLHSHMLPRMAMVLRYAKVLHFVGLVLMIWGLIDEGANVFDILVQNNLIGQMLTTLTECIINTLLIQICFVDLIFVALVKLRLYNGYMSDDVVLTSFCLLQGYGNLLNKQFNIGARQMHRQLSLDTIKQEEEAKEKQVRENTNRNKSMGETCEDSGDLKGEGKDVNKDTIKDSKRGLNPLGSLTGSYSLTSSLTDLVLPKNLTASGTLGVFNNRSKLEKAKSEKIVKSSKNIDSGSKRTDDNGPRKRLTLDNDSSNSQGQRDRIRTKSMPPMKADQQKSLKEIADRANNNDTENANSPNNVVNSMENPSMIATPPESTGNLLAHLGDDHNPTLTPDLNSPECISNTSDTPLKH